MKRLLLAQLFALSRFSINTYGIFLKFFLQLNGGYWARIGLTKYRTEDKIKTESELMTYFDFFKNVAYTR